MSENSERRLLGVWVPDAHPSTKALVWQYTGQNGVTFGAEVTRYGSTIDTLQASDLSGLAAKLIASCGPARKSMVRLGVTPTA
jgi:hypothetical protein